MRNFKLMGLILRARKVQLEDKKTQAGIDRWIERRGHADPYACLEDVANELGVSPLQLSYYFRVVVGKPFLTWRKEVRILDAQALLLKYPEKSLASIGEAVGIMDKSNFRKQFREVSSISPSEFRKKHSAISSKTQDAG